MSLSKLKNNTFQNPEVKEAYDALGAEFELISYLYYNQRKIGSVAKLTK